ncbi:hypothetical protein NQ314_020139 [Rhamnusium bicolor]|uniref:Amino acid transporter n=1 Tax=Rhamnusium bicolor TaxID=1586634 RepID=A0AAV8WLM1_9CUCU|nr:hypothetical protein NQ314_020139 [Rhamnusium bicolor]
MISFTILIELECGTMSHHHNLDIVDTNAEVRGNSFVSCLKTNALVIATFAGVILGAILGIILRETKEWTVREQEYVGYIGQVFLQMLKSLIVPLIVSSLVSAIASLDLTLSGKIAARAIAYYLTTTFAAVVLGIVLVVSIKPGEGHSPDFATSSDGERKNTTTVNTLLDLIKNMFPPNIVEASIFQYRTKSSNDDTGSEQEVVQTTNILGLVVASVSIGIALAQLGDEAKALANFFHSLMAVMMKITGWVISLSPVGVMFLVAYEVLQMKDIASVMSSLGKYFGTVCLGLLLQGFVVLPLLYYLLTRRNPVTFIMHIGQAVATAFGTASRSRSKSRTICFAYWCYNKFDGTALYEAVAAIFIAQVRGVHLDIGTLIAISITATAASIGAAGIPQAGMVTMVMVLETVGLDSKDISLILAVDWLLDRCRTAINVMGDSFGAAIVNHRSQKELESLEDSLSMNSDDLKTFETEQICQ